MTEGPSLYRLARLLSEDSAAAEDLVQVALLRAWKSWSRVCAAEDRAAYVRRILVNAARTGWRRRWRLESPSGMISAPSAHDAYQQVDDRHLPHVVAGESCPITPGASSTDPYVFGQQYGGGGPVWMVLGDRGDPSRGTSVLGNPETPGWLPRMCGSWHRATRGRSPSEECALTVEEPLDSEGRQRVPSSSSRQHRAPTAPTGGGFRRGRSGSPVLGAMGFRSTAHRSARRLSSICSRRRLAEQLRMTGDAGRTMRSA